MSDIKNIMNKNIISKKMSKNIRVTGMRGVALLRWTGGGVGIFLCCGLFLLLSSCGRGGVSSRQASIVAPAPDSAKTSSESEGPGPAAPPPVEKKYVLTNDFQDHSSPEGVVYLRLKSSQAQGVVYLLPPAQFGSVSTSEAIVTGFKVEQGCVSVSERDFPLWVDVCESESCQSVRRVGLLEQPAHYSISGIGSLMLPQINPASPCSEEFARQIQYVESYSSVEDIYP